MPNKMKSNNPPRRVEIRGQDHLLAYITPAEAQLLMDNGGSGEPGPMGIPAFYGGFEGEGRSQGGFGGRGRDYDGGGNERDGNSGKQGRSGPRGGRGGGRASAGFDRTRSTDSRPDRSEDFDAKLAADKIAAEIANRQAYEAKMGGITPGQATAMFGDARMAGTGFTSRDVDRVLGDATVSRQQLSGMLPELQARARRGEQIRSLMVGPVIAEHVFGIPRTRTAYDDLSTLLAAPGSRIQPGGFFGPDAVLAAPTGGVGAFGTPANLSQGYFGQVTYTGMPDPNYEGPFADLVGGYQGVDRGGDGREVVPTQTNPVTGEEECPEGYVFDADIQACRVSAPLANVGETVGGDGFTYEPGTYARMGLLDVAPEGLPEFAERYGAGFMTPEEFEAANLDYRRRAGTMAGIFQDPYNLQGMTLLS